MSKGRKHESKAPLNNLCGWGKGHRFSGRGKFLDKTRLCKPHHVRALEAYDRLRGVEKPEYEWKDLSNWITMTADKLSPQLSEEFNRQSPLLDSILKEKP